MSAAPGIRVSPTSPKSEARTNRGIPMTRSFTRGLGTMKHHILLTCAFEP